MKKTVLVSLLLICTNFLCFSNIFYLDGISFEYKKGWSINPIQQDRTTQITGMKLPNTFSIVKTPVEGVNAERQLEKTVSAVEDSYRSGTSKIKLVSKSNVEERVIGEGIRVQSIELTLSKNVYQRLYVFEKQGYMIQVVITGRGKKYNDNFSTILKSFSFNPE